MVALVKLIDSSNSIVFIYYQRLDAAAGCEARWRRGRKKTGP
jgi:hypothetical protein